MLRTESGKLLADCTVHDRRSGSWTPKGVGGGGETTTTLKPTNRDYPQLTLFLCTISDPQD